MSVALPNDPLLAEQWYLGGAASGRFDLGVLPVWQDYSGAGVRVAVIDDGFDYTHPEFAGRYLTALDYDHESGDTMPLPVTAGDNHGTAVLGIIGAAANNGIGGAGIAWGADLIGFRQLSDAALPRALRDAAGVGALTGDALATGDGADVVNLSFGWGADVFRSGPAFDAMIAALGEGLSHGRGGLGAVFVKSSGSNRAPRDSALREEGTAERLDSAAGTISVGAARADGWIADFSTPGANLLVTGLADDTANLSAIVTTDRQGAAGYVAGDHVAGFGGTSATAAQVSGIVALMLEARPGLGWRDVQAILAMTARHAGSPVGSVANTGAPAGAAHEQTAAPGGASWQWNGATHWNGGGLHVSNDYGFGIADARAAVRLAESWQAVSTTANRVEAVATGPAPSGPVVQASLGVGVGAAIRVEHVTLTLDLAVAALADLEVHLTSPAGTRIQMIADTGGTRGFDGVWSLGATGFLGELAAGTWTISVASDGAPISRLGAPVLSVAGAAATADDTWVFTDAYGTLGPGRATHFAGGAGVDTLNSAAVSGAVSVDLAAGQGRIAGIAITLAGIERVVTGDGADTVSGSPAADRLETGRGADRLRGGPGADTLIAGAGDDVMVWEAGDTSGPGELIDGGAGHDTMLFAAGAGEWTLRGADILSVEEIAFAPGAAGAVRRLVFDYSEFDSEAEFARNLLIRGDTAAGSLERITIHMGASLSADLSAWRFDGWGAPGEWVELIGDGSDETFRTTARADSIAAGGGNDSISSGAGDDRISAGAGSDTVDAGSGNDTVISEDDTAAGTGFDRYDGGSGFDHFVLNVALTAATLVDLGAGAVIRDGLAGDRVLNFEAVTVGGGASVRGGPASNLIVVSADFATPGNALWGEEGDDTILGGAGADMIDGGAGHDSLSGGAGADTLNGRDGDDTLEGGAGDDRLIGETGNDRLFGGDGADVLIDREGGTDHLDGGAGDDLLEHGAGDATLIGGAGDDRINAGEGRHLIEGGVGHDRITSGSGADTVFGGDGDDVIKSGAGDDLIDAGAGNDTVYAWRGNDTVFGGAGDDVLRGDFDADWLEGGPGVDRLVGAPGRDVFVFRAGFEEDRVLDYADGSDRLDFSGHSGVRGLADLSISQIGTSVVIRDASGGRVVLADTPIAVIGAEDFLFA